MAIWRHFRVVAVGRKSRSLYSREFSVFIPPYTRPAARMTNTRNLKSLTPLILQLDIKSLQHYFLLYGETHLLSLSRASIEKLWSGLSLFWSFRSGSCNYSSGILLVPDRDAESGFEDKSILSFSDLYKD